MGNSLDLFHWKVTKEGEKTRLLGHVQNKWENTGECGGCGGSRFSRFQKLLNGFFADVDSQLYSGKRRKSNQ